MTVGELFRLARVLHEIALVAATDPGQTPPSAGLVAVTDDIAHHEGTTVGETAARTGLAQSLVSKVVAQLREGGVVEIGVDESDRRRNRIRITESARAQVFAERGHRSAADALRKRFPERGEAQLAQIEARLKALADELRD
ncbi:MAG: MarR family winged helix-turn-helix transcriptional regulator [Candidatus Dormibacteraeota bacterium]|nr:MarR family winged helix-turn-helix transcriptional regulator [Candidatus Dormibacteraeota bacterium]